MVYFHLVAAATCALGSFIQGATGFGSGLVMMGLLPFVMDTKDAAVVVSLLSPFLAGHILWKLRRHVRLRLAAPLVGGMTIVGMPLGVWVFVAADASVLKVIIGASLILFCGHQILSRRELRIRGHPALAAAVGVAGGTLSGACSTGGPPIVLYVYMQDVPKEATSATLQAVFLWGGLYKIAILAAVGRVEAGHLLSGSAYLACAIPGLLLGFAVFRKINPEKLRRCVYVMLVAIGALLVAAGLGGG